jgi:hypothetical protein
MQDCCCDLWRLRREILQSKNPEKQRDDDEDIACHILRPSKYIDDTILSCERILEFPGELESIFFAGLSDIASLVLAWHLVEDDPSIASQKWSRIKQYIRDVRGRSRYYDIVLSLVIWALREVLGSILDRSDMVES